MYKAIVCVDKKGGIGKQGKLPWHNTKDMKFFKETTSMVKDSNKINAVIMGRLTWDSIPEKFKPLKNRINIIISSVMQSCPNENYYVFPSIEDVLFFIENNKNTIETAFVIGGASIYEQFLRMKVVSGVYLTTINYNYDCDVKFPRHYLDDFKMVKRIDLVDTQESYKYENAHMTFYNYAVYVNYYEYVNKEEQQYLNILNEIKDHGILMQNRTGIDTKSLFVRTMRFNMRDNRIPVLTTKRTFFRGGAEEMLFFLSGSTDVQKLRDKNIFFWDANTNEKFLREHNLPYKEYDMGATYGFLYRHFGAEYRGKEHNYTDQGFDQVQFVIDEIRKNPSSRRLIIDLWSPEDLNNCTLPPCLFNHIFYVNENSREISLHSSLRSSDFFLGCPLNLVNAAILLRLVCHCTGYLPGDLIVTANNAHFYMNQLDAVNTQLARKANKVFPKLFISTNEKDIFKIKYDDLHLINYSCDPTIKAKMAV